MEELQNLLAHLKNLGLTDAKIPINVWCGIIEYFANRPKDILNRSELLRFDEWLYKNSSSEDLDREGIIDKYLSEIKPNTIQH